MKACDVVTGLRAEVEQWRARAIQAEGPGYSRMADERRALLEAAAALVGRNAYNCTVADIVGDLEALRAQGIGRVVSSDGREGWAVIGNGSQQVKALRDAMEAIDADAADLAAALGDAPDAVMLIDARVVMRRAAAKVAALRAEVASLTQERHALLEAAAALVGHNPYTCEVATVVRDLLALRAPMVRGTAHDQIECQRAEIGRLRADLARAKAERDDAVQAAAVGEAVIAALNGEVVSDFMASYAPVQQAMDMRLTCDLLRADVEAQRRVILDACAALGVTDDDEADWPKLPRACAALKAERDAAIAAGKRLDHQQKGLLKQIDELRRERETAACAQALAESLHRGADHIARDVRAILANALGVRPEAHDLRDLARMVVDAKATAEADRPATVPAGGRAVSADLWERLSALADAVREVPDAD